MSAFVYYVKSYIDPSGLTVSRMFPFALPLVRVFSFKRQPIWSPTALKVSNPSLLMLYPFARSVVFSICALAPLHVMSMPPPIAPTAPTGIAAANDGTLWFLQAGGYLGKVAANGRVTTEARIADRRNGIAVDANDDIWFTGIGYQIYRRGRGGQLTEFATPTVGSQPRGIVRVGDVFWFAESDADRIGKIDRAGHIVEYALPTRNSMPWAIAADRAGAIWFSELRASKIGRLATDGTIVEYVTGAVHDMTLGADGRIWFTESDRNAIAAIDPLGKIVEFTLPIEALYPNSLAPGADGALWFTASGGMHWNRIGRITTSGEITMWGLPYEYSDPGNIVAGPGGAMWFGEYARGKLGSITASGEIIEHDIPEFISTTRTPAETQE
jgi:virginiamycin B lyase